MKVYVDTSFLISLYSLDTNSAIAAGTMKTPNNIYILSTLTELEARNSFQLRVFRKEISQAQARSSLRTFETDLREGVLQILPLHEPCFHRAAQISGRNTARLGTRTADLLHVAAAMEFKSDCLYSFDRQQRRLAETLKLKVNRYP